MYILCLFLESTEIQHETDKKKKFI